MATPQPNKDPVTSFVKAGKYDYAGAKANVLGFYQKYLGKGLDAGAYAAYINPMAEGIKSFEEIRLAIASSPEAEDYQKRLRKQEKADEAAEAAAAQAKFEAETRAEWTPKLAAEYGGIEQKRIEQLRGAVARTGAEQQSELAKYYSAKGLLGGGPLAQALLKQQQAGTEAVARGTEEIGARSGEMQRQELRDILGRQSAYSQQARQESFTEQQNQLQRDWTERIDAMKTKLSIQLAEKQYDRESTASIWSSIGTILGTAAGIGITLLTGGTAAPLLLAGAGVGGTVGGATGKAISPKQKFGKFTTT